MITKGQLHRRSTARRSKLRRGVVILGGLALYTAGLLGLACALDRDTAAVVKSWPGRVAGAALRQTRSWRGEVAALPRLQIRIREGHYETLRAERQRALDSMFNNSDHNTWVPAAIAEDGGVVRVKMRLKGALRDHWVHPQKWSFAIKTAGDRAIRRLRRFSIQHPRTRDYLHEWLFLAALRDEGQIALRFEFVRVELNGEDRGIYALEEQPDKLVLEHHGLREGPIIGFDKGDWIDYWKAHAKFARLGSENPIWFFRTAPITGTGDVIAGSPEAVAQVAGFARLEGFRSGVLAASEVFDVDSIAAVAALHAVLGAAELDWKDIKFYLNPITGKLQPIAKELHFDRDILAHRWWVNRAEPPHGSPFVERLFADPAFERAYVGHLDRLSRPEWSTALLARHGADLDRLLALLKSEFPRCEFAGNDLRAIGGVIRNTLRPQRVVSAHFLAAAPGEVRLEIGNLHPFTTEVVGLRLPTGAVVPPAAPAALPGKGLHDLVDFREVAFALPAGVAWREEWCGQVAVEARVRGLQDEFRSQVFGWRRTGGPSDAVAAVHAEPSIDREFLVVDEAAKEIRCLPGEWVIRESVVVPPGYRLLSSAGMRWDLRDGASVLSRSPVQLIGTAEQPVVIESSDGTGGGLAVIGAAGGSRLEHVLVRGLSASDAGSWQLSGAVTFYESPVDVADSVFAANQRGDDLVNLIRSKFTIARSTLRDAAFDALDVDFCEGVIEASEFRDSGNDAIDTSGSVVEIRDVVVTGAGDKGMSFGEASRVTLRDFAITGAVCGIAVKDDSEVQAERGSISGAEHGIAVFRKKPEFGPGRLVTRQLELSGNGRDTTVEVGATLDWNGVSIAGDTVGVLQLVTR